MMPCGDNGQPSDGAIEIDHLTKMLCGLCRRVFTQGLSPLIDADPTLAAWWSVHKARDDRQRAEEESRRTRAKIAKRAKAKLTPEEREALGIRD